MRILKLSLATASLATASFVKNIDLPICIRCRHYIQPDTHYGEDPDHNYGKCRLFGKQDLVTGDTKYDYASVCRINEKSCGVNGKYFKEKDIKNTPLKN